ncbi:cysteine synthase A [Halorientalis salina]|uniref:cysteine synthase A n=1 Tax=Halorientalis salina TaxID=2932266 RepID=UPI0010ACBB83|nr:cysteine synthase A [Halorientalis salina]
MEIAGDVTEEIGRTPLVRLDAFAPNLVGKVEGFNPFSVKDRIAEAMIERGEREGAIDEGTTIVESTSGNTGIGLALVCAARGYDLVLTMPESMSGERRKLLSGLGAELRLTPADGGMDAAIEAAHRRCEREDDAVLLQQFENEANPRVHRETTGAELWDDTDGELDVLVAGVGTGGTITGISEYFKESQDKSEFHTVAVEPASSPVLSGGEAGSHGIQGIGAGFVPDVLRTELIDEVETVTESESLDRARALAGREGIAVGISGGAALEAAVRVARRDEHADDLVGVVLPDSAERYLSTTLFEDVSVAARRPEDEPPSPTPDAE